MSTISVDGVTYSRSDVRALRARIAALEAASAVQVRDVLMYEAGQRSAPGMTARELAMLLGSRLILFPRATTWEEVERQWRSLDRDHRRQLDRDAAALIKLHETRSGP